MQSKMQEQMNQQQGYTPQPSPSNPEPKKKGGDYIDFEEVKWFVLALLHFETCIFWIRPINNLKSHGSATNFKSLL